MGAQDKSNRNGEEGITTPTTATHQIEVISPDLWTTDLAVTQKKGMGSDGVPLTLEPRKVASGQSACRGSNRRDSPDITPATNHAGQSGEGQGIFS